jgi:hypothetical protein
LPATFDNPGLLALLLFLVAGAVVLAGIREAESSAGGEPQVDSILVEG